MSYKLADWCGVGSGSYMYKIIGGDQQEYGPVSAEEIRRWIREGRLNNRSPVRKDDAAGWAPLADFPEFAEALRAQAGQPPPTPSELPPLHAEAWTAEILAREPQVRVGECLSLAWQLLKRNFGLVAGSCAVIWAVGLCQFVPVFGGLLSLVYPVLWGAFYGGLFVVLLKAIRGEKTGVGEAFSGFNIAFGQLVLAGFLSWLLAKIGFCFCVLPWIYLSVAWVFSVPLVADKRLEFWSAMELSRKVVTKVWFEMFALIIVVFLPVIFAGLFAGAKVSTSIIPAIERMISAGPQEWDRMMQTMMRLNATTLTLSFFTRLVLLLNLPFALAALMYAYENLFGARTPAKT